jgi:hypothetical protein
MRSTDLFGELSASQALRSSEGRGWRVTVGSKVKGEGFAAEEAVRSSPEEGWGLPTKLSQFTLVLGRFHLAPGVNGPWSRACDPSGEDASLGLQGSRRVEDPRFGR